MRKLFLKFFNLIKSYKKNIPDTYKYSNKYPPPRSNYKYTDKLFIACILYVTLNNSSWISFIGPIPGKQVHKKFKEYIKMNCFKDLFEQSIEDYLCTESKEKLELISIDSSTIYNKQSLEVKHKNPYNKNKKCSKISAMVDSKGSPISITLSDSRAYLWLCQDKVINSNKHDCKIFNEVFDNTLKLNTIKENNLENITLLADKGYDTKTIREKIYKSKMKAIIAFNKRRTKDKSKIRKFNEH